FVRPGTDVLADEAPVHVVDQVNENGRFDEHKVMMGFPDAESARAGYLENYTDGWQGLGAITETTFGDFKRWLEAGDTTQRFARDTAAQRRAPAAEPVAPDEAADATSVPADAVAPAADTTEAPADPAPADPFANNTLFTADKVAAARA